MTTLKDLIDDKKIFSPMEMAEYLGIGKTLKAVDQMKWVRMMNNIRVCAEEAVLTEIVYR